MKKTFAEVVLLARTGLNPRKNFKLGQGNNNYITIKNIKNNTLVIDENTDVVDDEAIKLIHKRSKIKKGDILFASIGRMGDMYIIEDDPVGWDINESVFAFTLDTNIVRQKYFYYIFRVKSTLDYLASNSSGSTFKSIKMNQLKKMTFDIPPLEKQDQIVATLDKVCNVIEMRKQELISLDDLIKARFVEMFYGKRYPVVKWNNVFNTTTGKLDSNAAVDDGVYPFFTCSKEALRIDKYAFDQEALLLAGNNAAGKYDVKYYNGKFNAYQRTYVLGLKENWSYRLFQYQLEDKLVFLQQQSLGGLTKYLTLKILGKLDFIIPPMDKQKEFEQFVNQVDKSKVAVQKALDETQLLFNSLMQEYFG